MPLPSNYLKKLVTYRKLLDGLTLSKLFKHFDPTYFNFMIIGNEDFTNFSKKQKIFHLSDEEVNFLRDEFDKVNLLYHKNDIPIIDNKEDITHDVPIIDNKEETFHGMKISSVFNNIDKEAQRKKVEEIIRKNHSSIKSKIFEMEEMNEKEEISFADTSNEESLPHLDDPSYEFSYHFDSSEPSEIENIDYYKLKMKQVEYYKEPLDLPNDLTFDKAEEYFKSREPESENTINSDSSSINEDLTNFKQMRWNIKENNYIYRNEIYNGDIRIFRHNIKHKRLVLYKMTLQSVYDLDLYLDANFTRLSSKPTLYDKEEFASSNFQIKIYDEGDNIPRLNTPNEVISFGPFSSVSDIEDSTIREMFREIFNKQNNNDADDKQNNNDECVTPQVLAPQESVPQEPDFHVSNHYESAFYESAPQCPTFYFIDFERSATLIYEAVNMNFLNFIVAMDVYANDELINEYKCYITGFREDYYDHDEGIFKDKFNYVEGIKNYVSYKLGTDKFFNFHITKDSPIYKKYRRMGLKINRNVSFSFDPNNMPSFKVMRPSRVYPNEKSFSLLSENILLSYFAFLRSAQRVNYNLTFDLVKADAPIVLPYSVYKNALDTIKTWKKANTHFTFSLIP